MERLLLAMLGVALLLVGGSVHCAEGSEAVVEVGLEGLTRDPDKFDGQHLRVSGYLRVGYERSTLCPTEKQAARKDCVWLSGRGEWRELNGKRVSVHGAYAKRFTGHMGCCSGTVSVVDPPALAPN